MRLLLHGQIHRLFAACPDTVAESWSLQRSGRCPGKASACWGWAGGGWGLPVLYQKVAACSHKRACLRELALPLPFFYSSAGSKSLFFISTVCTGHSGFISVEIAIWIGKVQKVYKCGEVAQQRVFFAVLLLVYCKISTETARNLVLKQFLEFV